MQGAARDVGQALQTLLDTDDGVEVARTSRSAGAGGLSSTSKKRRTEDESR